MNSFTLLTHMDPKLQPGCTSDLQKCMQLKLRMPDLPLGYSAAFPLISIALVIAKVTLHSSTLEQSPEEHCLGLWRASED